jgi:CYTH domain-containing protein/predicted ATPase
MSPTSSIHRIVLTGGPCGGKSSALTLLRDRFLALGYQVFLVPEAPTILAVGGVDFVDVAVERLIGHEANVVRLMLSLEDAFLDVARASGKPAVVFCDRGVMDVAAYMKPQAWQAMLDEHGWTIAGLRDRRYDAVIHLVSAAVGAEAFYTTANNTARTETAAQARALDARVQQAWLGHPTLRVIDNSTEFAAKVRRVAEAACDVVGARPPMGVLRKFLVRRAPAADAFPVPHAAVDIELIYLLTTDGSETRIRRRGQGDSCAYAYSVKCPPQAGQRIRREHPLSGREYFSLLAQADPTRRPVKKKRLCFVWDNQYFELDTHLDPAPGLTILQVEMVERETPIRMPPFLETDREVTDDPDYTNAAIAARRSQPLTRDALSTAATDRDDWL